jgi:hypothetical protein
MKFYEGKLTASDIDDAILALGGLPINVSNAKTCITCKHYYRGLDFYSGISRRYHGPPDFCQRERKRIPRFDVVHGIEYYDHEGTIFWCSEERSSGKCGKGGRLWIPK